jgi:hypothetical protein
MNEDLTLTSPAEAPAEVPAPSNRNVSVDSVLAAMVTRAVDTVVIENDEVMNNSMVTEYWHNSTKFRGCYPNKEARKAPQLPRWYCRVHVGKNEARYIYRGTLYQCALAADIWEVAVEPFRKLIVLGYKGPTGQYRTPFNISEAIAREAYRKDGRIATYFMQLLTHFETQGLIVNWFDKRRKMDKADLLIQPLLKRGHLSSFNFAKVVLEAVADLKILFRDVQVQLDELKADVAVVKKRLEPPVEYYDPTQEGADPTKPGEGAISGLTGSMTIRSMKELEQMEAKIKAMAGSASGKTPAQACQCEGKEPFPICTCGADDPAPGNTKEPSQSIFG